MTQIPPIEDAYIDSIIKSGGAYQPSLTKTQGVKLRELVKLLRDRFEQEITTLPAIIGVKAQNFRLSRVYITDNFGGEANAVSISAGELIHFEYSNADEQNVWQLQPLVHGGLAPEVLYYVYCKCSKTDQSATYIVTTEEIKPEDEPGFYMFLAGVLYPALDGYRDSDFTNGVADITGGRIKIGKIMSRDGQTGFDLDNGTIFGKISFRDIAGSLKEIKEVDAVAAKALKDAANAQISATTANTLLANVADDNLLMPAEKQDVLKEWQIIQSEKSVLIAQAATYTVAVADFDLAYSNLNTYISPLLLSMTTNSTIVGTTLRNNFKSYYDAKIALLKAVSDKAKQLSDAAQSTAAGAQTSANNAQISANTAIALLADIANDNLLTPSEKPDLLKEWQIIQGEKPIITAQGAVYSIATTTYDNSYNALNIYITPLLSSLTTNSNVVGATFRTTFKTYYDAKVSLLKLVSDKAKQVIDSAQSDASAAITNAANAQVSASNAQTSSNTANQLLADIANDNLVTPSEKPDILKEWQMIQSEKLVVNASAGTYLLSTSIFDIAYNNLSTYVMPILANMVVNTIVVGATLRANFKAYYDAKIALLKLVSDSAKTLVDNIQVGGRNYFKKTTTIANGTNMPVGVAPGGINIKNGFWAVGGSTPATARLNQVINSNGSWTVSGAIRSNGSFTCIMDACDGPQQSVAVTTIWQSFSKTFKVNTWTNAGYDFFDFGNIPGLYLYLYDLKIEKGTQATDWSIAQEDLQADLDIAKSQATLALQELDDIAADNKLTPLEKKTLSKDLNEAFNEVNVLISQANTYGVSYADYNTKYLSLLAYGNPLIANMNTVTDIVRATFVATFNAYYTAKISLLKLITDAAYGKIEGIQIGGRNYFKKTTSLQAGSGAKNIVKTDRGFSVIGVNENTALIRLVDVIKSNGYWTVSFDVSVNAVLWNSSKVEINDLPGAKQFIAPITPNKQHVEYTVNVTNWTDSVYNFIDFYDLSGQTYYFDNIKVEKGTKASDWTPAPEDVSGEAQAKADLAKSEAIVSANDFATTIATTKANAAQAAAQSAASSDAQTKANTAYNTALAASKTYADTAAGSAKSAAQMAAAADASTKATQAYNDAQAAANVKYNTLTSTLGNMAYRSIQAAAGQGVTVVDNGSVLTFLVDAAYVKANVINAGYLTGLELNFTKGTIGGLFIQNNGIASSNGNFSISSAGVLTATQANISGNVNATTGTIGGFSIGSNFMESATSYNGGKFVIYPNDGFIAFLNNDSGIWTGMGHNVMPAGTGITAVGRFENGRSNSGGTNIGLYINATGASNNYALEIVNGGIRVNGRKGLSGVAYCSNVGNNVYNGIEFRDGLAVASGQYNLSSRPPGLS